MIQRQVYRKTGMGFSWCMKWHVFQAAVYKNPHDLVLYSLVEQDHADQNWYTWLNIDSDNGLLTEGTKPLLEPMLTSHLWVYVAFMWDKFHSEYSGYYSV